MTKRPQFVRHQQVWHKVILDPDFKSFTVSNVFFCSELFFFFSAVQH